MLCLQSESVSLRLHSSSESVAYIKKLETVKFMQLNDYNLPVPHFHYRPLNAKWTQIIVFKIKKLLWILVVKL